MIINLEINGVDLDKWADSQQIKTSNGRTKMAKAEADLRRSVSTAAERWLHQLGFKDAKVRAYDAFFDRI